MSENKSILSDMKPSKAIVSLAIPATLALLAKAVYNLVDTAYIGMLDSDIALTAVGVTVPLLLIMVSLENIFAAGAAVLAGRQLGAQNQEEASRTVWLVPLGPPPGTFLCSLHSDFAEAAGCGGHLRLPARSGCSDHPGLCVVNPGNETGGFPEYERIGAADSQLSGLKTRICP